MEVRYIQHTGDDLAVANAARVSFAKESEWDPVLEERYSKATGKVGYIQVGEQLSDRDRRLIAYLARHGHWTPFAHTAITLHMKIPIFVARQIHKHQVGFVVNEVSRRYVDEEPEFYEPKVWRRRAEDKKQGSSDEWVSANSACRVGQAALNREALLLYDEFIRQGVAPEQARMVLPLSTYTEFWMTGSLAAWARLYRQRIDPHAQRETQEVARQIGWIIEPLFPISWGSLQGDGAAV